MTIKPAKKLAIRLFGEEIIERLRNRGPLITRDDFYATCRIADHISDDIAPLLRKADNV